MEYIVTVKTDKYGWCLHKVCGTDKDWAEKVMQREQAAHPDKEFRVEEVASEDCWWNETII